MPCLLEMVSSSSRKVAVGLYFGPSFAEASVDALRIVRGYL